MMQVHGCHTNVSGVTNSKDLIRCQNIWWTVYVLERQISVLLGAPLAINDSDITASLPNDTGSRTRTLTASQASQQQPIHSQTSQTHSHRRASTHNPPSGPSPAPSDNVDCSPATAP